MGIHVSSGKKTEYVYLDCENCKKCTERDSANPNPLNFNIVDYIEMVRKEKTLVIVQIEYPNCKNHKGMKLCVYDTSLKVIILSKRLDPHFSSESKDGEIFPIARFEPTENGWKYAKAFCNSILEET